MENTARFKPTKVACYLGYIVQATVNNYAPLLFVTFQNIFDVSLERLAFLSAFNFITQLTVDLLAAKFADRIGYRRLLVAGQLLSAAGLSGYALFPYLLPPFSGLLLSSFLSAAGGGLIEVLISPVIEACPSDSKSGSMSLLHSFYCWGQAGVVLFSTLFFSLFSLSNWRILAGIWALLPLFDAFLFLRVPLNKPGKDGEGATLRELFSDPTFLCFALLIFCAGAAELGMSQWASAFSEKSLGVEKSIGDLAGPCLFGLFTGAVRLLYSLLSRRVSLPAFMTVSGVLCLAAYLLASLAPHPGVNLAACALCGFSVGVLWPGTLSLSARLCPRGGTLMYGPFAVAGDLGCIIGTGTVGFVADRFGGNLKMGMLFASVFPLLLLLGLFLCAPRLRAVRDPKNGAGK